MDWVWEELGIAPTGELRELKRAYARRLKECRPEDDLEAFQQLRTAYEAALRWIEGAAPAAQRPAPRPQPQAAPVVAREPFPKLEVTPRDVAEVPLAPPPETAQRTPRPPPDPAEQAHALVARVLQRVELFGDASGARELQRLLKSPELSDERVREHLERALLLRLAQQAEPPWRLLAAVAEICAWEDPQHPLREAHAREIEIALHAGASADALEFLQRVSHGDDVEGQGWNGANRRRAASFLLQPPDEREFGRYARRSGMRRAFRDLFAVMERRYGAGCHLALDEASLRWWRQSLRVPYLGKVSRAALVVGAFCLSVYLRFRLSQQLGSHGALVVLAGLVVVTGGVSALAVRVINTLLESLAARGWVASGAVSGFMRGSVYRLRHHPYGRLAPPGVLAAVAAVLLAAPQDYSPALWPLAYAAFALWSGHLLLPLVLSVPAVPYDLGVLAYLGGSPGRVHFFGLLIVTVEWKFYRWLCARCSWKPALVKFIVGAVLLPVVLVFTVHYVFR